MFSPLCCCCSNPINSTTSIDVNWTRPIHTQHVWIFSIMMKQLILMAHWIWNGINPQGYFTLELSCRQQHGILYKHTLALTVWIFHLIGSCLCPRPHQKGKELLPCTNTLDNTHRTREWRTHFPRTKPLNVPMTFLVLSSSIASLQNVSIETREMWIRRKF